MAEVDPRILQFERESASTLASIKRARVEADAYRRDVAAGRASFSELESRVEREVARGRVRAETVGRPAGAIEAEEKARRQVGRATDESIVQQRRERRELASTARARQNATRSLLSLSEAQRRFGRYAGQRFFERQTAGLQQRYGEFAGGRFAQRLGGPIPVPVGGGGSGGGGRVPPTATGGAGGFGGGGRGGGEFRAGLAEEQRILAQGEKRLQSYGREAQRLTQVQASAGNVMRRSGVLTTEFIQAAARGETTIRELGQQTTGTIGKFGAWLVAGSAVYAAFGAVQQMGRGAIDAYDGVNKLNRVIDDVDAESAREQFRGLAREFDLPIEDVTESAYQLGKIFHDQNQALVATEAILNAVKVGELDAADATRYLTAAVNGFQLPAEQLGVILDQVNEAQQEFGISIQDVLAGLAASSGTFKAAGGDITTLLALLTAAQKATGQSGQSIGTAIRRAPGFIRRPSNQETLQQFGIDPEAGITEIFTQAFEKARTLGGKQVQELAEAIFGGRYGARIGTPLLSSVERYEEALRKLDPAAAKGSALREREELQKAFVEQIKSAGIELQALGSNLQDSGLLTLLGLMVTNIDDALSLVNNLLEAFNDLPDALKSSLGLLVQISLILRLLQRFNVGAGLAPAGQQVGAGRAFGGALLGGGDRRDARLIRAGFTDEQRTLEDDRIRYAGTAREQQERALLAQQRANDAQRRVVRLTQQGQTDTRAYADSVRNSSLYTEEAVRSREAAVKAALDEEHTARRLTDVNKRLERSRGRFGRLDVGRTLQEGQRVGGFYRTSFDQPSTARPAQLPRAPGGGVLLTPMIREVDDMEKRLEETRRTSKRLDGRFGRVRSAAGRAGAALNGLIGRVGTFFFGFAIFGLALNFLNGASDSLAEEIEDIEVDASSAESLGSELSGLRSRVEDRADSFNDLLSDFFTGSGRFSFIGDIIDFGTSGTPFATDLGGPGQEELRQRVEERELANRELQARERRQARAQGGPVPFRFVDDIQKDIQGVQRRDLPRQQAERLLSRYEEELANSMEALGQGAGNLKQQGKRLDAARKQLRAAGVLETGGGLTAIRDVSELGKLLDARLGQLDIASTAETPRLLRDAGRVYQRIARLIGNSSDPEDISTFLQERDKFLQGVEDFVQGELEGALALAQTPGQRQAAYGQAYTRLRKGLLSQGRAAIEDQQGVVRGLRERLRSLQGTESLGEDPGLRDALKFFPDAGSGAGLLNQLPQLSEQRNKQVAALRRRIQAESRTAQQLTKDQRDRIELYRQIVQQLREQQYQENAAQREARLEYRVSLNADPLREAALRIDFLGREIQQAIKVFGRGSEEVFGLLQQQQQAIQQQAETELGLIEARSAFREAGLSGEGDEIAQTRERLQGLRDQAALVRSQPRRFEPRDLIDLETQIRETEIELQESIEDRAEELRDAAFNIAASRAEARGDDVAAATARLRQARFQFRRSDTPLERRQNRDEVIQRRADRRQSIFDAEIEDIEFQTDIGKLSLEQQISAYQGLLRTMRLTRDMRRDLRRRIHQLRQEASGEGGFDLAVGDIQLPTIYEVRRAMRGGVTGQNQVIVNQRNNFTVNGAQDPTATAQAINRISGGANRAALRSAGLG